MCIIYICTTQKPSSYNILFKNMNRPRNKKSLKENFI